MKGWMGFCAAALLSAIFLAEPSVSSAGGDESLHFGFSAAFGAAGESIIHYRTQAGTAERILYGTLLGSLPGLAKEVADSRRTGGHFSGKDMAIDIAGALAGAVIANWVNGMILISATGEQERVSVALMYRF